MNEDVAATVLGEDEAEALAVIEPLDGALEGLGGGGEHTHSLELGGGTHAGHLAESREHFASVVVGGGLESTNMPD